MALIKQLDQNTINKIAAGEVIERPCAVVKELVENAIDAKSNAITIEIKEGGISFIRITDNGCGINEDDIQTAFLRHATSKITSIEDLLSVTSLGFRGEALSSIAAVAQVELITKQAMQLMGTRYVIEGGKEVSKDSIGCPEGTTFIVRNLFYNTPVRRKFLKTPSTEASHIADYVEKLALSHPDIAFKFINNGQIKLNTSGNGKQKDIIYGVFGREITSNILEVDSHSIDISVTGFIGKAVISRGNRNLENYFINGRYIKSSLINKAIEEAYKSYMMVHKYPFTLLNINIDSGMIDVNVHPTKMEIRFMEGPKVYDFIYHTVKEALDHVNMIPEVDISTKSVDSREFLKRNAESITANRVSSNTSIKHNVNNKFRSEKSRVVSVPEPFEVNRIRENVSRVANLRQKMGQDVKRIDEIAQEDNRINKLAEDKRLEKLVEDKNLKKLEEDKSLEKLDRDKSLEKLTKDKDLNNLEEDKSLSLNGNKGLEKLEENKSLNELVEDKKFKQLNEENASNKLAEDGARYSVSEQQKVVVEEKVQPVYTSKQGSLFDKESKNYIEKKNDIRIVGQVFLTYWIIEFEGKMYIIDQHAAHEKVLYERIMKDMESKEIVSQNIAPPIIVTLNMNEEEYIKEHKEEFVKSGFEIEHFGGKEYSISAIPANLPGKVGKDFFLDVLDNLMDGSTHKSDILLEKIASMSCKAAVKGNNKMSYMEMERLIEELFTLDNPYNCPHGRPTTIAITQDELEKKFKRQV